MVEEDRVSEGQKSDEAIARKLVDTIMNPGIDAVELARRYTSCYKRLFKHDLHERGRFFEEIYDLKDVTVETLEQAQAIFYNVFNQELLTHEQSEKRVYNTRQHPHPIPPQEIILAIRLFGLAGEAPSPFTSIIREYKLGRGRTSFSVINHLRFHPGVINQSLNAGFITERVYRHR